MSEPTSDRSDYIFVYGTLRREHESGAHQTYLRGADFIAPAKVQGQLYLVADYPGLTLSDNADHWAQGEIYLITHPSQLHELDVYEGCAKNSPQPHEYARQLVEATLSGGEPLLAWAYVYVQETQTLPLISSGDFLNHY